MDLINSCVHLFTLCMYFKVNIGISTIMESGPPKAPDKGNMVLNDIANSTLPKTERQQ